MTQPPQTLWHVVSWPQRCTPRTACSCCSSTTPYFSETGQGSSPAARQPSSPPDGTRRCGSPQ
eukprot:1221227-Rhodomonas_salina.1